MTQGRDLIGEDSSPAPLPPPSLADSEDAAACRELAARIRAAIAPANVIEEICARDVADLTWDVVRLRRIKAGLFRVGASDGMVQILRTMEEWPFQAQAKAREWTARRPAGVAAVNSQLSAAGLDMSDVATSTFAARIERMLAAAEVRRAAALPAIDNRRAAERARAAAEAAARAAASPVEEGEFTLVPAAGDVR